MAGEQRIRTVRVFVSSPSDVAVERERVALVARRLNELFSDLVRIEPILWEEKVYSSAGGFQDQIFPAAGSDLVVAIFWSRLGTPLPEAFARMEGGERYPSGTAYEVLTAIEARRTGERPDVYVFRKSAPPPEIADGKAQWMDLNGFFSRWFQAPDGQFLRAFHRFEAADDFEKLVDRLLRNWIAENVPRDRSLIWPIETMGSPFRALLPFDAKHAKIYFGRDRKVTRAIEQLQSVAQPQSSVRSAPPNVPFLLIVGESGAGKSSLMRAGLAPRLTAPGVVPAVDLWRMAVVRVGDDANPFLTLAKALLLEKDEKGGFGAALPELSQERSELTADSLADLLEASVAGADRLASTAIALLTRTLDTIQGEEARRRSTKQPLRADLLLMVDQVENIFAQTVGDERRAAFARLLFALCATRRVWTVATVRSDIYPRLITPGDFLALKDAGGVYDLAAPGESELVEIVHKSAAAAGLGYEKDERGKGLDEIILADAHGKNTLPLLQFALERLFEDRVQDADGVRLTVSAYRTMGGLGGAINQTAEAALGQLAAEDVAALPRLLRSLAVPVGDNSGAAAGAADFTVRTIPMAKAVPDEATERLVTALTEARIIVTTSAEDAGADSEALIGIAHQRVFESWDRARAIIAEHRDFFRIREEVESQHRRWDNGKRPSALLLAKGVPLAEAQKIVKLHTDELSPELRAYVTASNRKAQRFNIFMGTTAAVFALLAVVAFNLKFTADENAREAQRNFGIARETAANMIEGTSQGLRNYQGVGVEVIGVILGAINKAVDKLKDTYANDPLIDLSRAAVRFEFAKTYQARGNRGLAFEQAKESYDIRSRITGYDQRAGAPGVFNAAPGDWRWELSNSVELIGDLNREEARGQQGDERGKRYEEARRSFLDALTVRTRLAENFPDRDEWLVGPSYSHVRLGDLSMEQRDPTKAKEHYRLSMLNAARIFNRNRESRLLRRELSWNFNKSGDVKLGDARADANGHKPFRDLAVDALVDYRHSLCIRRDLVSTATDNTLLKRDVVFTLGRTGDARSLLDDRTSAELDYLEALSISLTLWDSDNKDARYGDDVAFATQKAGAFYERADLEKALAFYEYSAEMRKKLIDLAPRREIAEANLARIIETVKKTRARLDPERLAILTGLWWQTRVTTAMDEFTKNHPKLGEDHATCWAAVLDAVETILSSTASATIR